MREAVFIRQNMNKWRSYESAINDLNDMSPDELADMYTELTADLAFAQTHYPDSIITKSLNDLTLKVHSEIYKGRPEKWSRLKTFWTDEVPLAVYEGRWYLIASFLLFVGFIIIGVVSTLGDGEYVRFILGDGYVDMTMENIANGDPMGVYKDDDSIPMFFMIVFNNLRVGIFCYSMGLLSPLGPTYVLMYNGTMVGAFFTMFYQQNVLGPAFLGIMQHGTLELSTIVLEGGAGLWLASCWLFPGTYSRGQAFRRGAKQSLKLAISVMPITVLAAVFESFVTRHTEAPIGVRVAVIVLSAAFIIYYYIVLPYLKRHEAQAQAK